MRHLVLAVVFFSLGVFPAVAQTTADVAAVLRVDDAWQQAQRDSDVPTLARIMADEFYGMNQNGNGRDKAQMLELWSQFGIRSLTTDSREARIVGDTASVSGTQTEVNATGVDRMVFMRVYIRDGSEWRLLSKMQFPNPK
jgi:ketosteroid isomerase-like protein